MTLFRCSDGARCLSRLRVGRRGPFAGPIFDQSAVPALFLKILAPLGKQVRINPLQVTGKILRAVAPCSSDGGKFRPGVVRKYWMADPSIHVSGA